MITIQTPKGPREIGEGRPAFIVAELGKNHNGNLELGKLLIDRAAEAGADAVKFQTHVVDDEQSKVPIDSPHFKGVDRYAWVKRNTYPPEFFREFKAHAESRGIVFFSTPMSRGAAQLLHDEVGVPLWKVGSGDITDLPMIEYEAKTGIPIIISSGMTNMEELRLAVATARRHTDKIVITHCVSLYPCPPSALNLKTMDTLRREFPGIPIGFSDNGLSISSSVAAVALGAVYIEKHMTIDRGLYGPDHKASLIPSEFAEVVKLVREAESAMGDGKKTVGEDESKFRPIFHKSLVAMRDIPIGSMIMPEMLRSQRPCRGIPAKDYYQVLGKTTKVPIPTGEFLQWEHLE